MTDAEQEQFRREFSDARQRAQGGQRPPTFVPAERPRQLPAPRTLEGEIVPSAAMAMMTSGAAGGHARSDDDALKNAQASLVYSAGYIVAFLMITVGLLLVAWMFRWLGDRWPGYVYGGLLAWGIVAVITLLLNRKQGLYHSPSGIAHHEIDSRTDIAFYAIDTQAELLRERWRLEDAQERRK